MLLRVYVTYFVGMLLLVAPLAFVLAQQEGEPLSFESLEELEEFLGKDLPDDFDYKNFGNVPSFGPTDSDLPETLSCFDYYEFGSVDIQLQSEIVSAVTGVPLTVSVDLTNTNPYPVVDGSLYIKVFRKQDDNVTTQIQGDHIVDSFYAAENLAIREGETESFTFEWTPSHKLPSGDYYFAGYFVTNERYNLAGLSFTDDIIGTKVEFSLLSDSEAVYFDKGDINFNGTPYQVIGAPPTILEKTVTIDVPVVNDTNRDLPLTILWNAYAWDALSEDNQVAMEEQDVVVQANSTQVVSYTFDLTNSSVFLVVPEIKLAGERLSMLNARFVQDGVDTPRINFPSVLAYPLVAGENTVFSCLHNSGQAHVLENTEFELHIEDAEGNIVHEYHYDGPITGAMMAVEDKVNLSEELKTFTLHATLKQNGEVIEEAEITYDCGALGESGCPMSESEGAGGDTKGTQMSTFIAVLATILVLIIMAAVVVRFSALRERKEGEGFDDQDNNNLNQ